jgi:hypothetical protein
MITLPLSTKIPNMLPVLKLFLIPVGGGIPAGIMLEDPDTTSYR